MKIAFDFDGVLTDQTAEALRTRELFLARLAAVWKLDRGVFQELISLAQTDIENRPFENGWRDRGRITAFAEEDLFVWNNGLAYLLDHWRWEKAEDPRFAVLNESLSRHGYTSVIDIAQWAFSAVTQETRSGQHFPLEDEATELLRELLLAGHEVVVISNSGTDRILDILGRAGLDCHGHDPLVKGTGIRVRGGARKFTLGTEPRRIEIQGVWVDVDRPHYEEILREEDPDYVIGDVFSLDLALPLFLRQKENARVTPVLRERKYTPMWIRDRVQSAGIPTVRNMAELQTLVNS